MAIRTVKSTAFAQLIAGSLVAASGAKSLGKIMHVAGHVDNLVDDLQGSEYHLLEIPASAIMLPTSAIRTTGWGFAQAVVGIDGATDALLDVTRATGGATGNNPITIFGATWNQPIWQQLGMSEDPGNPVLLKVFTEGDATVAGQLQFDLHFANHI